MDGSTESPFPAAVAAYEGLPDSRVVGRHRMFPRTTHDDVARINFLAQLNRHLAMTVAPHVKSAWERRVEPELRARTGRTAADRHEAR